MTVGIAVSLLLNEPEVRSAGPKPRMPSTSSVQKQWVLVSRSELIFWPHTAKALRGVGYSDNHVTNSNIRRKSQRIAPSAP